MTNFHHKASGIAASGMFWSFGLYSSGSLSEAAAETGWSSAVQAFFATAGVAALFHTGTVFNLSSTSTMSPTWKQTTRTQTTHTAAGSAATQQLPDFCAAVVTLRSANSTKSAHGRWFLPPFVSAALSMGPGPQISSGNMTTLATAISTLFNSLATSGLSPLLLTRKATLSGLPAFTTQAIVSRDISNHLHVQKRRGDKLVGTRTTA